MKTTKFFYFIFTILMVASAYSCQSGKNDLAKETESPDSTFLSHGRPVITEEISLGNDYLLICFDKTMSSHLLDNTVIKSGGYKTISNDELASILKTRGRYAGNTKKILKEINAVMQNFNAYPNEIAPVLSLIHI